MPRNNPKSQRNGVLPSDPYFGLTEVDDPEFFFGSLMWVHSIMQAITDFTPRPREYLGLPGMGKSALMRYLAHPEGAFARHPEWIHERFRDEPRRIIPVLVSFKELPHDTHPFTFLHLRINMQIADRRTPPSRAFYLGRGSLDDSAGHINGYEAVSEIAHIGDQLDREGYRMALLLDDFDIAFAQLSKDLVTAMRPWRNVISMILVTERSLHLVNSEAASSPFYTTVGKSYMRGLPPEDSRRLLVDPAKRVNVQFPEQDIDFLLDLCGGKHGAHPFLLLRGASILWELRNELSLLTTPSHSLRPDQKRILEGNLSQEFQSSFHLYWQKLSDDERDALTILASQSKAVQRRISRSVLSELQHKGLVHLEPPSSYLIFSSLFTAWIQETIQLKPPADDTGS